MVFVIIFVFLIAAILGWVSSYYNKFFMSIIFGLPVVVGGGLKLSAPIFATADMTLSEVFASLPASMQLLIMLTPLVIIGGRISGWIYQVYFEKEKVEDKAKKRRRILAEYGMEDPLSKPAPDVDWLASMSGGASKSSASSHPPRQRLQASSVRRSKRATSFGSNK